MPHTSIVNTPTRYLNPCPLPVTSSGDMPARDADNSRCWASEWVPFLDGAAGLKAGNPKAEIRFLCKTPPDSAARDRRAGRLLSTFGRLQPDFVFCLVYCIYTDTLFA